jgi:predicted Na+-dependent transporter
MLRALVAALLGRHFWIFALAMMAAGLWLPGDYVVLRPLIPILLGGILFCSALKVRFGAVLGELHGGPRLRRLALLSAVKLAVLPLAAWAVARTVAPDWALGVLLVMAMPAGLSATAMTDLYGGNVALALVLTFLTSVLCPLTVPLLLQWLDPAGGTVDAHLLGERALYIVLLLVIPFGLAQAVRRVAPALVQRHVHRWTSGAVFSSCALIFVSIAVNRPAWAGMPGHALLVPLALDALGMAMCLAVWLVARRTLPAGDAAAFALCCAWMNNGLAVAFADRFFPGRAGVILGPVLMQLPIIAGVALIGARTPGGAQPVAAATSASPPR